MHSQSSPGRYSVRQQRQFTALAYSWIPLTLLAMALFAGCTAPQTTTPAGPTGAELTPQDCSRAQAWEGWLNRDDKKMPDFCATTTEGKPDKWCEISLNRAEYQKQYMVWRKNRLSSARPPKARAVRPQFGKKDKLLNLAALQKASISSILRGLGKTTRAHLKVITQDALGSSTCSSALFLALGSAWENFLPKAEFEMIGQLYDRSASCSSTEAEDVTNTRFRGGLFYYAAKDYTRARDLFAKSASAPSSTRARSLFWLYRSHLVLGETSAANSAIDKLESLHPTSFHGVLGIQLADRSPKVRSIDRWFTSRSDSPVVNTLLEATEALQSCSCHAGSITLSNWTIGQLPSPADPKLLLYVAKLREKASENPVKIAIAADALSSNPSLISRETLELFYPRPFWNSFESQRNVIDPYFLAAVARQESAFDPGAVSSAKATGLLQLIPQTARRFKAKGSLRNPKDNIEVGARYLNFLLRASDGKVYHTLAGYNAGPGKVKLWMNRYQTEDPMLFVDLIPYRETREYVSSVLRNYFWYRTLYGKDAESAPVVAGAFPADPGAVADLRKTTIPLSDGERASQIAKAEKAPPAPVLEDKKAAPKEGVVAQEKPADAPAEEAQDPSKSGIRLNKDGKIPDLAVDAGKSEGTATADHDEKLEGDRVSVPDLAPGTSAEEDANSRLPEELSVAPEIDKSLPN